MNVWLDGLYVLADQRWAIAGMILTVVWGQILISNVFRKIFDDRLTRAEYFSLGMAGWILPVAFVSLLVFIVRYLFGGDVTLIALVVAIGLLFFVVLKGKPASGSWVVYSALVLFFFTAVFLNLAFLRRMILPLYFDSAEHYRIINYFLKYFASLHGGDSPAWPLINYYHIGYHFLTASLSAFLQTNIVDTMLVFGQILISALPLSVFFIVRRETGSDIAALFASLLAGFGWHMPGHALNWGKYPALLSLVCIHFVLCVVYLIFRNDTFKLERPKLFLMLGFGVLISGLIHTRSLIVYAVLAVSMLLSLGWKRLPVIFRYTGFVFVVGILVWEISYTRIDSILEPLLNTYLGRDLFVTGLVLFLVVFSAYEFLDITFFTLVTLTLLLFGLFVPVGGIFPAYGNLVLLDRPYVQMLLYVPLSIFGGLGLAGFDRLVKRVSMNPKILSQLAAAVMFGCVTINAVFNHEFRPSSCCQLAGLDDLAAITWMDKNLPLDANILIASTGMYVTSLEEADAQSAVDGGVWITPLISRMTIPVAGGSAFDKPEIRNEICVRKFSYVYVGGEARSFDDALLTGHPEWYQRVLSLPGVKIYKVVECE